MSSISTASHWLWNFIIAVVTLVALYSIGWRYYIVFTATSASVPLIVLPLFAETMNRNLELIDRAFKEAPTIWDIIPMARRLLQGDVQPKAGGMNEEKGAEAEVARVEQKEFA
ncbi:hypothetical protein ABOM_000559 [Aspergillus bombycis]|uniref:Uncharacterized protein n=1 Tax=Aspergillus bombycis TaxID=109264 RepID=A0A1F8AGA4_9EURO|nr:hypothetical protein ABOM_000559 [Aspergillus bombycis]OGM50780.1 hypothetical protein ABOM_000559 [Aspergillus bombycis]